MKYLNQIKKEAAKKNVTLKQLADSINVNEDIFKAAVKNGSLSIDQLSTICRRLNIEMSEIFSKRSQSEPHQNKQHFFSNKLFC